ncbi:MAG: zeta toxin family protein [Lachnospiraceae bacterium]|nr:zeta toxin family protein [Lachnospiraceae bacterium]
MKRYVIIAGVNGAGKSTMYGMRRDLQQLPRINTDEILKSFGDWRSTADLMKAGKMAVSRLNEYLKNEVSFNQETTLCGKGIVRNIQRAKQSGYTVELHFVGLDDAETAKARVAYRVAHGGHGIPEKDIEKRYVESFENLKKVLPLCDLAVLYDNTVRFRRFAIYRNGSLVRLSHTVPQWYERVNGVGNADRESGSSDDMKNAGV